MKTTLKNIFVNPELQYIRSGWRIGIYLLIMTGCSFVVAGPGITLVKMVPAINTAGMQMLFVYLSVTLATWVTLRFIDKRPFISIGLTFKKDSLKELGLGLLLGTGMMSLIFVIEYSLGFVHVEFQVLTVQQQLMIFGSSAFLYIIVGYGEEILFRGYILQVMAEGTSRLISALFFGVLFAFAHSKNPNASLFGLINVGLAGIWLALAYYRTNALWLPIGLHISWNFCQGFVYGYPVSGTSSNNEQISKAIQSGAEWITGGAFGPEGGALATVMLVLSSLLIYYSPWFSSSPDAWTLGRWRDERKQLLLSQSTEPVQIQS